VSPLAPDQLALLRALERHGVEFVVVGGVAAQIHGWRGATADLDILRSKEAAGRAKDLAALDQMRADLAGSGSS
jgi:hypothetical protein